MMALLISKPHRSYGKGSRASPFMDIPYTAYGFPLKNQMVFRPPDNDTSFMGKAA